MRDTAVCFGKERLRVREAAQRTDVYTCFPTSAALQNVQERLWNHIFQICASQPFESDFLRENGMCTHVPKWHWSDGLTLSSGKRRKIKCLYNPGSEKEHAKEITKTQLVWLAYREQCGSLCWETTTAWRALYITFRRLDFIPKTIQVDEWKGADGGQVVFQDERHPSPGFEIAQNQLFCFCPWSSPYPFFPFIYILSSSLSGKRDEVKTFMLFMIPWPAQFPRAQTKRYTASQKEKVILPETLSPSCSQALLYESLSSSGYFRCFNWSYL